MAQDGPVTASAGSTSLCWQQAAESSRKKTLAFRKVKSDSGVRRPGGQREREVIFPEAGKGGWATEALLFLHPTDSKWEQQSLALI